MSDGGGIAVVGMACRLPGAPDLAALWRLLCDGVEAIDAPPPERLPGGMRGGFIPGVDMFDAAFFGISPREASASDPQQRLALELSWECLEDAGIVADRLAGAAGGVFVGVMGGDYAELLAAEPETLTHHSLTGVGRAIIANRISYTLRLAGPSLAVDTGQSSSLVAVHLACESLLRGESELALAGGVNLILSPLGGELAAELGALSPEGRCYAFDARANGHVRGEGGGMVALKRLADARADGDRIYGVIRGSATNTGSGERGLTVPSPEAQVAVIEAALARAGVGPEAVQYVELHGTGTPVGDPIEAAALGAVYGRGRAGAEPLAVGSIKTNIGHLEGAAGVAGLIKAALCVHRREVVPSLNFSTPSPSIPLRELGLRVACAAEEWPAHDGPIAAGVSSFGMGGANAHVILQEAPRAEAPGTEAPRAGRSAPATGAQERTPPLTAREAFPLLVSGRGEQALRAQAERLRERLLSDPAPSVLDVAFSLACSRTHFEDRGAVVGGDRVALLEGLQELARGEPGAGVVGRGGASLPRDLAGVGGPVFVFPGQGAQWEGMAVEMLDASAVFRDALGACAQALEELVDWRVEEVLRGAPGAPSLERVDVVQPVSFAVMVALAELWRSFGVEPAAVVGHSQGEIAAACVAGGLSLQDAARVVVLRSRLLGEVLAGRGGMVSVGLDVGRVEELLEGWGGRLSVAAVNGPTAVVVSGEGAALEEVLAACERDGVWARRVAVDYASHSAVVEELRERLLEALAGLEPASCEVPFFSTAIGGFLDTAELDAGYWYRSLRERVRFGEAARALAAQTGAFVEVSPHPVLGVALRETLQSLEVDERVGVVGSLRRGEGGPERFLHSLAEAWVHGVPVRWDRLFAGSGARRVDLPTYAFQRERHWLASGAGARDSAVPLAAPAGARESASPLAAHAGARESAVPLAAPAGGSLARRLAGVPREEWDGELLSVVRSQVAAVLGHGSPVAVEPGRAFKELGLDSVGAEELRKRLTWVTDLRLPATLAFDHPSAAAVAAYLRARVEGEDTRVGAAHAAATRGGGAVEEPVAIVGMSCRYPGGAGSPQQLWELLARDGEAVGEPPGDRGWDLERLRDADPDHPLAGSACAGGFLHDAGEFDAGFFGIGAQEALAMDPQQRLLLEAAWEALEDAGLDPAALRGSQTGVFAGMSVQDYLAVQDSGVEAAAGFRLTGTLGSVLSGRVAYTFGFEGPAVSVDTACSSSLVALHLACQAVRRGECSLALAGGVTVMASPAMLLEFSRQRGLSPDGRSRAFAAGAQGVGWSEGAGLLVVERLSDARRLGHRVLAVVRGSAVNQDGASNGLTAPNGPSQERVIGRALADAGLAPADVDAVEAHGTGTRLGDPIEAQALLATYGRERTHGPLWLGSIKSNIGHTQAAAGVAGVIKIVKALEHGLLPRTLHVDRPTPHVDWSAGEVELLTEPREWRASERPRRAGVSSFGISGTNAHVILEEPPAPAGVSGVAGAGEPEGVAGAEAPAGVAAPDGPWSCGAVPLVVSGRGAAALNAQAARLRERLLECPEADPSAGMGRELLDVAFSAAGRAGLEDRGVVVGGGRTELLEGLGALAGGDVGERVARGVVREGRPVFVFPGQGAQWEGMAVELLDSSEVFGATLRRCDEALGELVDWRAEDVLRGVEGAPSLERVDVVQPVSFAVMVALAELWGSFGVRPGVVVGHSQGEIAAACVAGGLSLQDATRVVVLRSRLLGEVLAGRGGMVSVAVGAGAVQELLERWGGRLSVAAVNGPSAVVVSGETGALDELLEVCQGDGVWARRVAVDYASHSAAVEELRERLVEALEGIEPVSCGVQFFSTARGELVDTAELDGEYWYRGLRERVRFEEAVRALAGEACAFVEVSPHPVLGVAVGETLEDMGLEGRVGVVGSLRRGEGGWARFVRSLADAWVVGAPVQWGGFFAGSGARRVDLPRYAFQRERFWLQPGASRGDVSGAGLGAANHPLLGAAVQIAGGGQWLFTGRLSLETHTWLADHAVLDTVLLPGTGFLELALAAGRAVGCEAVEELTLQAPLVLEQGVAAQLQVSVGEPDGDGRRPVSIHSRPQAGAAGENGEGGWTRHAEGTLVADAAALLAEVGGTGTEELVGEAGGAGAEALVAEAGGAGAEDLGPQWPPAGAEVLDVEFLYDRLAEAGYGYGPEFQGVQAAWRRGEEVYAEVALGRDAAAQAAGFGVHPALLDAALHAHLPEGGVGDRPGGTMLPFALTGVCLHRAGASALRVRLAPGEDGAVRVSAFDEAGRPVLSIAALAFRPLEADRLGGAPAGGDSLARLEWVEVTPPRSHERRRSALLGGLELAGVEGERYGDLDELARAVAGGAPAPDLVFASAPTGAGTPADSPAPAGAPASIDAAAPTGPGAANVAQAARAAVEQTLALLQSWLAETALANTRLVLLTSGAAAVGAGEAPDPVGAAVWGLLRSAQTEHPGRLQIVDTDPRAGGGLRPVGAGSRPAGGGSAPVAGGGVEWPGLLAAEESQLAVRGERAYAPRLTTTADPGLLRAPAEPRWCLGSRRRQTLEDLALIPSPRAREPLGPGEIRVAVHAAGVNFRDVWVALGLGRERGQSTIGGEGAGVVLEVGEDVEGLAPGDRVMGLMDDAFGPVAVTDRELVVPMPAGWSFVQAAAVPSVFMTAYYGLMDLARLRRGESLLVHSATGGVGMAALQLARHVGVEVFATASPGKAGVLAELGLDAEHAGSSRDLQFAQRFLDASGGRGVDVVLNSLAHEFVDASLGLLPRGGRFIEMGKTDIRDAKLLAQRHPGVAYRAFDLYEAGPRRIQLMLRELLELFAQGALTHSPITTWDVRRGVEAFRFLREARHVGKIVLTIPQPRDPEGTVLVTGGTGGLGAEVARHLAATRGAGNLLLASRRGAEAQGAGELVAELAELGCDARVVACDVADRGQAAELIASIPAARPLTSVIHAAGVLDDGLVESLTAEQVERVMRPKADAALNLHELTADLELAEFVMFSSAAGLFGGAGQGNYAAANAFLDALAQVREAQGLAGQSLAWGLWEQASGMTGGLGEAGTARMARLGLAPLSTREGLDLLDRGRERGGAFWVAARMDMEGLRAQARAGVLPVLLSGLVRVPSRRRRDDGDSLARRLAGVPKDEREAVALEVVREQAAAVLERDSHTAIDSQRALKEQGLDSLGAVELRNRLAQATGLRLPSTLIFDYPSAAVVAGYLIGKAFPDAGEADAGGEADPEEVPAVQEHAAIDEMDVETLVRMTFESGRATAETGGGT